MKLPIQKKHRFLPNFLIAVSVFIFSLPSLHAQNENAKKKKPSVKKVDPYAAPSEEELKKIREKMRGVEVGITIEYFKLDHRTANKLIRRFAPKAANAKELRDILGEMTNKGEAELIETGWVRARSGQRAKTESVSEEIHPTEYDPTEIPNNIGGSGTIGTTVETKNKETKAKVNLQLPANQNQSKSMSLAIHMSSATPSSFDMRNVGFTMEVDPVIAHDLKEIDLNLSPEIITRLEDQYFIRPGFEHTARGIENIVMPTFYILKTTTQITTIPGNYHILGFNTPHDDPDKRIIVLLKADLFRAK